MNSFLFIVILLFFSFLSVSALASATLPITQTACQAVFCAKKNGKCGQIVRFGDKMSDFVTKFLPSFDPYRGLWQPKCPLSTELLSLSGHCDACYGSGHRHDSRIVPAGATAW